MPIQDGISLKNWTKYCYCLILLYTVFTLISCHRKNELGIKSKTKADSVSKPKEKFSLLIDNRNDKQVETEEVSLEDEYINFRDSALAPYKGLKYFTTSCKIRNKDFELEVVSRYLNDTIHPEESVNDFFITPIILDQKLVFKKRNKILKVCRIPNSYSFMRNTKGKKIKVLEFYIFDIELLKGNKSNYFHVYGNAKCTSGSQCFEYNGLYDMYGNEIIEPYPYNSINIDFDSPIIRKRK